MGRLLANPLTKRDGHENADKSAGLRTMHNLYLCIHVIARTCALAI